MQTRRHFDEDVLRQIREMSIPDPLSSLHLYCKEDRDFQPVKNLHNVGGNKYLTIEWLLSKKTYAHKRPKGVIAVARMRSFKGGLNNV